MHLDQPIRQPHSDQPQPQPPCQCSVILHRLGKPFARYTCHCQINLITDFHACDALMKQRQRKAQLQLDHHRRLRPADRHNIRRPNFGFHHIPLIFQKGFDGRIKVGFACTAHFGRLTHLQRQSNPLVCSYDP